MRLSNLQNVAAGAVIIVVLLACDPARERSDSAADPPGDPVVVYAAFEDRSYLPGLLSTYTKATGVPVIVRNGGAAAMVDDVIANNISPPADLLWTPSVADLWRAAEDGALRPQYSQFITDNVPQWLRDPDAFWVGVSYRNAVLVYDPGVFDASDLSDYAALAEPRFGDRLCLASSVNAINRTVIAMLIDALQTRPAEIAVRGWMANLARPVFDDEQKLLQAIQSGSCSVGIASSSAVANARGTDPDAALAVYVPALAYADAEAVGIARHARNAAGAAALVEWLLAATTQDMHAKSVRSLPANRHATLAPENQANGDAARRNVLFVARNRDEAIRLAERARYR